MSTSRKKCAFQRYWVCRLSLFPQGRIFLYVFVIIHTCSHHLLRSCFWEVSGSFMSSTPPDLEMLQRWYVTFHVIGAHICSLYEVMSVASVTLSSYFLLSGTREYSHVPSSPVFPWDFSERQVEHTGSVETLGITQAVRPYLQFREPWISVWRSLWGRMKKFQIRRESQGGGGPRHTLPHPLQMASCIKLYKNFFPK